MAKKNPRIDDSIARAAPFAQPVLAQLADGKPLNWKYQRPKPAA